MFYVITFDISDNKDRYRAVKVLKGVGGRVQKSVFECANLSEHSLLKIQTKLEKIIDHTTDSVRYYRLCRGCVKEVEWNGGGSPPSTESFKVI
jgi:CRISPR-associated protein Cas2